MLTASTKCKQKYIFLFGSPVTSFMLYLRSMVETVYTLRDQVLHLAQQNQDLYRMIEEEIAARKKLEAEMRERPQQQVLSSDLEGTSI